MATHAVKTTFAALVGWLALAAPAAAQTAAPPVPGNAPEAAPVAPFADLAGTPEGRIKSLLFTPEEASDIRYALGIYRKHAANKNAGDNFDEQDFLNKLTGARKSPSQASQFFTYPQFFLQSLVYHSADNWIVWIENQKLTQDSPVHDAELSVIAIDADKATILWRPVSPERIRAIWESIPNNEAKLNKQDGTFTFILRPNQTFSSYVMRPLEGRVQPVTVDSRTIHFADESDAPALQPSDIALEKEGKLPMPKDSKSGDDRSREGLTGLIGAYSNIGKEMQDGTGAKAPPAPAAPQEKKP